MFFYCPPFATDCEGAIYANDFILTEPSFQVLHIVVKAEGRHIDI